MTVYYKATRLNGKDFYSGTVDYAAALTSGKRVRVTTAAPTSYACCTGDVLHASTVPTETLIGGSWPCRLFEVTGRPVAEERQKRGFRSLLVVREIDAHLALGPQGSHLADLIGQAGRLSLAEMQGLAAAGDAARDAARDAAWAAAGAAARAAARAAAWDAARDATRAATRAAAWVAAWAAARDATRAAAWVAAWVAAGLAVRDLIGDSFTPEQYDLLTGPWRTIVGPIHPDDADLRSKR